MVNVHVLHECHREMSFRMKSENLAPSSPLERFWSQVLCPLGGPGVGGTPPPRVQAWASQPITVTGSSWCPGDTAGSGGGGGQAHSLGTLGSSFAGEPGDTARQQSAGQPSCTSLGSRPRTVMCGLRIWGRGGRGPLEEAPEGGPTITGVPRTRAPWGITAAGGKCS